MQTIKNLQKFDLIPRGADLLRNEKCEIQACKLLKFCICAICSQKSVNYSFFNPLNSDIFFLNINFFKNENKIIHL